MKVLKPVEKIYQSLTATKNLLYDLKVYRQEQLPIPVISVGNLSFGGVGKTPCVHLLAQELSQNFKITVICRSYKTALKKPARVDLSLKQAAHVFGDEACLLQSLLPECEVWSGPVKSETAQACLVNSPQLVIVDDGFSHRALARNFDLVLIDSTRGLQSDYFREPLQSLKRAHAVILTKTNLIPSEQVKDLQQQISQRFPGLPIYRATVQTELSLDKSGPLFVFSALAKPQDFTSQLRQAGYQIVAEKTYSDHHMYSEQDEDDILKTYKKLQQKHPDLCLVTTEKDAVKIGSPLKSLLHTPEHKMLLQAEERKALFEKIRKSL